jgi:hypothetical protein
LVEASETFESRPTDQHDRDDRDGELDGGVQARQAPGLVHDLRGLDEDDAVDLSQHARMEITWLCPRPAVASAGTDLLGYRHPIGRCRIVDCTMAVVL